MSPRYGAGPTAVIGADIPGIRRQDIAVAFKALRRADTVFGPSGDGGYWLVGLAYRQRGRPPFSNVRWSSPNALADTVANLGQRPFALIAQKDDVDEPVDLTRLAKLAQRLIL